MGKQVDTVQIDPLNAGGDLFGLIVAPNHDGVLFVDDGDNTLKLFGPGVTSTARPDACTVVKRAARPSCLQSPDRPPVRRPPTGGSPGGSPPPLLRWAPWQWGTGPRWRRPRPRSPPSTSPSWPSSSAAALLRVPFRRPLRQGGSNPAANLGICVTREVIRSFMGYTSSLPIPEFRSVELVLDDICKVIMPPVVRRSTSRAIPPSWAACPASSTGPAPASPIGVILYLHGGGYIGTSPQMYAFFTSRVCKETDCAVFVADYRLAPEFPYPAGEEDATAVYEALRDLGVPNERLFLAGDSGGGGLANSMLLSPRGSTSRRSARPGSSSSRPRSTCASTSPRSPRTPTSTSSRGTSRRRATCTARTPPSASISPLTADLVGFPPTFVAWGGDEMFRDPDPALRRAPGRRRRAHPRPRVRGHVPRLPDPHALGREEPRVLRPPPDLRAEAGGRRPGLRSRPSCATCPPPGPPYGG